MTYSPYLSRVKLDDIGELHLSKNSNGEVYTSFSGKEVYFEHYWSGILESNGFSPLMKLDNAVPAQWDYHAVERVDDELVLILRDRLDNISSFSDIQRFVTFKLLKYDLNGNYVGAGYNASNVNVNGVTLETWGLPNSINSTTAKDQLDLLLRESKVIAS